MEKAIEYAIRSLTIKRQTEQRMLEKIQKRFPRVDSEAVVERLKELDYLNDQDFSKAWVRYRTLSSPRGHYGLRQELKGKGIAPRDMEEALAHFEDEEPAVLLTLARKKWALIKEATPFKKRNKLQRFLLSRGFPFSEVIDAVNSVANADQNC